MRGRQLACRCGVRSGVRIRTRKADDLPVCAAILCRVHEATGYRSAGPTDPEAWLDSSHLLAVFGHAALCDIESSSEVRAAWERAVGGDPSALAVVSRLSSRPIGAVRDTAGG